MTTTVLLLNLGILAFVLKTGLGVHELNRRRFTLPLGIAAVVGALYLHSMPTSTGAVGLITVLAGAGVILGVVAGTLMKVRRTDEGSLVTVAGPPYAAVWIAVVGGRLLFAYGADHWFAAQIAELSRSLGIIGSAAWTTAFVIMAMAMVATRVAVTAVRAARLTGNSTWAQRRPAVARRHSHLHRHA